MPHFVPRYQIMTLFLFIVAAFVVLAFYQQHQTAQVNRDSYERCIDRAVNINKLNAFYEAEARLINLDTTQPVILRQQQADLYRAQVFAAPKCGQP